MARRCSLLSEKFVGEDAEMLQEAGAHGRVCMGD